MALIMRSRVESALALAYGSPGKHRIKMHVTNSKERDSMVEFLFSHH